MSRYEISSSLTQTLFGVSRGLEADERLAICGYLRAAWRAQYGRAPSTLSVDLELLADLFRSHVQAKRLRDAADKLDAVLERRPVLPEAIYVAVDKNRGFVTPEGRVLLEELDREEQPSEQVISRDAILACNTLIADFYGGQQRQWMRKELSGGDLRPATLGFLVFLLINNSIGERRAFLLPASPPDEEKLAARVLPVVNAFSMSIANNPVKAREQERLRSNWIITETKRQMSRFISRLDIERSVSIWIIEDGEDNLIAELGQQLAKRKTLTPSIVRTSLENTVREYDNARPMLTSWGLAHERPGHTSHVIQLLLASFEQAVSA